MAKPTSCRTSLELSLRESIYYRLCGSAAYYTFTYCLSYFSIAVTRHHDRGYFDTHLVYSIPKNQAHLDFQGEMRSVIF